MNFETIAFDRRTVFRRLAGASVLTLLLAACGGDGGAGSDGTANSDSTPVPPVSAALPDTRSTAAGLRPSS